MPWQTLPDAVPKSTVKVRLADRSPPPVRPVPALSVSVSDTAFWISSRLLVVLMVSGERTVSVFGTAVMPLEFPNRVLVEICCIFAKVTAFVLIFAEVTALLSIVQVAPDADTVMSPLSPSAIPPLPVTVWFRTVLQLATTAEPSSFTVMLVQLPLGLTVMACPQR